MKDHDFERKIDNSVAVLKTQARKNQQEFIKHNEKSKSEYRTQFKENHSVALNNINILSKDIDAEYLVKIASKKLGHHYQKYVYNNDKLFYYLSHKVVFIKGDKIITPSSEYTDGGSQKDDVWWGITLSAHIMDPGKIYVDVGIGTDSWINDEKYPVINTYTDKPESPYIPWPVLVQTKGCHLCYDVQDNYRIAVNTLGYNRNNLGKEVREYAFSSLISTLRQLQGF